MAAKARRRSYLLGRSVLGMHWILHGGYFYARSRYLFTARLEVRNILH